MAAVVHVTRLIDRELLQAGIHVIGRELLCYLFGAPRFRVLLAAGAGRQASALCNAAFVSLVACGYILPAFPLE